MLFVCCGGGTGSHPDSGVGTEADSGAGLVTDVSASVAEDVLPGATADSSASVAEAALGSAADLTADSATESGSACTVEQPADWANWSVSDSPNKLRDNGDGTTYDATTGLTWMNGPLTGGPNGDGTFTWAEAQGLCACPWRLPQRIELFSIVDYTTSNPAMNAAAFTATSQTYWTATRYRGSSILVYAVDFAIGGGIMASKLDNRRVRCVQTKTSVPASRYTVSTNDSTGVVEVHDSLTQLHWKQAIEPETYAWADARVRCTDPYRLPTVSELQTLVVTDIGSVTTDPIAFPNAPSENIWSSTPYQPSPGSGWYVHFFDGLPGHISPGNAYQVRCVR